MKICIISSNINRVEERVCIWSLCKNRHQSKNIITFNASTGSIVDFDGNILVDTSDIDNMKGSTAFSLGRFALPNIIREYPLLILDPDILVIKNLDWLSKIVPPGYIGMRQAYNYDSWATSVMLVQKGASIPSFDRFLIQKQKFGYKALLNIRSAIRSELNLKIYKLSKHWNNFDRVTRKTKIVHFTNLRTQPYIYDGHPLTNLWVNYANQAYKEGFLTDDYIEAQKNEILPFDTLRPALKNNWNQEVFTSVNWISQYFADLKFHGPIGFVHNFFSK